MGVYFGVFDSAGSCYGGWTVLNDARKYLDEWSAEEIERFGMTIRSYPGDRIHLTWPDDYKIVEA